MSHRAAKAAINANISIVDLSATPTPPAAKPAVVVKTLTDTSKDSVDGQIMLTGWHRRPEHNWRWGGVPQEGCNVFGCWPAGGGCNAFGCW